MPPGASGNGVAPDRWTAVPVVLATARAAAEEREAHFRRAGDYFKIAYEGERFPPV